MRKDIMSSQVLAKEEVYEQIDKLFHSCATVSVREHHSGFPAVTVDCGEIHILTDCLSLEEWWAKRKEGKESGGLASGDT